MSRKAFFIILPAMLLVGILLFSLLPFASPNMIGGSPGYSASIQGNSTEVGGYISANTTWTLAGSPYIVEGDIIVEPNVWLTINPGVTVKFTAGTSLVVDGSLIAVGNSTHRITFSSNAAVPAPGDWAKIWVRGTANVTDVNINYASTGILSDGKCNVTRSIITENLQGLYGVEQLTDSNISSNVYYAANKILSIDNCICSYNSIIDPEKDQNVLSAHSVLNCVVSHNVYGDAVSSSVILNCTISFNAMAGGADAQLISHCNIANNGGGFIRPYVVEFCNFSGNGWVCNPYRISDSMICNNGQGLDLMPNGVVERCNISYNTLYGVRIMANANITQCEIAHNNGPGIAPNDGGNLTFVVHCSNIYDNTNYDLTMQNIFIPEEKVQGNVNATNNWWGTTNETLIKEHIYDYYDDYTIGRVFYQPYLTSPFISTYAHVRIEHPNRTDLNVAIGVGNPSNPQWSKVLWKNQDGGANLDLAVDVSEAAQYLPPSETNRWFLKVVDNYPTDLEGRITEFTLSYNGINYSSPDVPVLTYDLHPVYAYIPSVASAHVLIEHTFRGDLIVDIGVGNPAAPNWTSRLWDGTKEGGSKDNLDLKVDLSDAIAYLPPAENSRWFLKVYDRFAGDQGRIVEFTIMYRGTAYSSKDAPVPILDLKTSYAYVPTPSASAKIYIEHTWVGDLNITLGCGNPSSPLWSKLVWNRAGGSQKNLSLTVDLSTAVGYLPPSNTYRWYLKVYDAAGGDTGRIVTFNITYQGKTYSSPDIPVSINDLKTSYAYIPSNAASAHIYVEHTYRGDLVVDIGVGNTASPLWSSRVWNRQGGSADNLDLTVDLSAASAYLPPSNTYTWFLKVYDAASGDTGRITQFSITYQGVTYTSTGVPVPVTDLKTSYAYIPSPAQAHVYIQHTYRGDLIVDIGVGSTSTPLWSKRIWNGTGGSADNLDLYIDLSAVVAYLPPSATYTWWVKVYDRAAGDTGKIVTFTIAYQGKTYTSPDVPVPINDLKTSYAYIEG